MTLLRTKKLSRLWNVDVNVREVNIILRDPLGNRNNNVNEYEQDDDFSTNSRKVRLETIFNYCRTAFRFLSNIRTKIYI